LQARALGGLAEAFADVAVVEAAAERVAEDEVARLLGAAGESVLAQAPGERGGENDLAPSCLGLERRVFALAGELAVDADQAVGVVDVGPGQAERFADPQTAVSEELEQESVVAGVFERGGELLGLEDRRLFRRPVRLLGRFELGDRIRREPATADGVAADLAERYQGDYRGGRGECALVRL
jgi:hypothetical protein